MTDARARHRNTFVEPTRSIELHWGSYTGRYLGGLTLIVSSMIGLSGTNPYVLYLIALNTVAQAAGWWILPATGPRRLWSVLPGIVAMWMIITGPAALFWLGLPYAAWLWTRQRPALSFVTVPIVVFVAIGVASVSREFSAMPVALGIMAVVIVGCAWLAHFMAREQRTSSEHGHVAH